mgnify:CR=1 FL=1
MTQKSDSLLFRSVSHPGLTIKERHSSLMALLRSVHLHVVQHIRKARWWLVVPISIVTTYLLLGSMLALAAQRALPLNIWDALFNVFGNQYLLFFCLTPLYLYLVSDLATDSRFSEALLLRLGSRRAWWIGKVATLGIVTGIYLGVLVAVAMSMASFVLPWESGWSAKTVQYPIETYLPPEALTFAPGAAFGMLVVLLGLGWFCLGLAVVVGGRVFGSARWGFMIGLLINMSAIFLVHTYVPPPYDSFFVNYHMMFTYHAFGDSTSEYPSIATSLLYWLVWIIVLFPSGWWLNARHDFLRHE